MKVIDLLNKIANEDEIPEKIKYENYIYWYDKNWKDYKNAQVEFRSYLISCRYHNTDFLNEEVEIIDDEQEEDKKIEKFYFSVYQDQKLGGREVVEQLETKINEIIDYINKENK
jgi:hypothetical protein